MFLARSDPPAYYLNHQLVHSDHPINADYLGFPIGPASDISLRLPSSVVDLDFRYFGVSQAMADTGPLLGVHSSTFWVPGPFPPYGSTYVDEHPYENRASLKSSLQSAELNLRH